MHEDDCFVFVWNRSLVKDGMVLYQHSAHCSSAMQWFLDENPDYWPFVPVEDNDDPNNEHEGMTSPVYSSWISCLMTLMSLKYIS
jgi:hypothetical protein